MAHTITNTILNCLNMFRSPLLFTLSEIHVLWINCSPTSSVHVYFPADSTFDTKSYTCKYRNHNSCHPSLFCKVFSILELKNGFFQIEFVDSTQTVSHSIHWFFVIFSEANKNSVCFPSPTNPRKCFLMKKKFRKHFFFFIRSTCITFY